MPSPSANVYRGRSGSGNAILQEQFRRADNSVARGVASTQARGPTMGSREVKLLFRWTGKRPAKPLGFAPRLENSLRKASERDCRLRDEECDHD